MTSRVPLRPLHHAAIPVTAVMVVALVITAAHQLTAATASTEPWTKLFATGFQAHAAADAFTTRGPGTWSVKRGEYVLDRPPHSTTTRARQPLSLLSKDIPAGTWRLRAVLSAQGQRADASVVYGYQTPKDYWFVHLDEHHASTGVYRVKRGAVTLVSPLSLDFRPGRDYVVRVESGVTGLDIRVGQQGRKAALAGHLDTGPTVTTRVGFGTWRSALSVDSLRVHTRATLPPATSSPTGAPTTATTATTATSSPSPAATQTPVIGLRNITVGTSQELTVALAGAQPGDAITMLDGTYTTKGLAAPLVVGGKHYVGTFVASVTGTAEGPIVLQGSAGAIIDGKPGLDGTGTQYGLYLADVDHWQIRGITVRNVSKGIVLDQSNHVRLDGVQIHDTGQEGIHLRAFSSDNIVIGNTVMHTGQSNATYGEGIYVGSANSNWSTYSSGVPDASDRNQLVDNIISQTGAESMDIKEGTTGGLIQGNSFDGAGMTGSWADSWIDMKGNGWTVQGNYGVNALQDGFQVHGALAGWGLNNLFRDNTADVRAPGCGFWLQNNVTGNVIGCDNTVLNAAAGFANGPCQAD